MSISICCAGVFYSVTFAAAIAMRSAERDAIIAITEVRMYVSFCLCVSPRFGSAVDV